MKYVKVDHREPLMEGKVPKTYAYGDNGELYECVPEPGDYVEDYDGIEPDTDTYRLVGREEYWGWATVCKVCGTQFMAYDKNYESIRYYCPGCGKELVKRQNA